MKIILSGVVTPAVCADVSFSEGVYFISGRIGSGKSTLASVISGLTKPVSGEIIKEDVCSLIFLMQFPEYQITGKTVADEIKSWGADEGCLFGNFENSRDPFTLSRGELKRLMLSCVFSKNPDVLILDEPFASLDSDAKEILCGFIEERKGITLVFSHETKYVPASVKLMIKDGVLHYE
ncbi:MAG: energy-coupling factor ABC transporter ATP-binding protein [Methanocorpusculum sp.]|nr:energy-coupling factor ABC transporter ATP-binding protein [Methanocorpusculum sp.]